MARGRRVFKVGVRCNVRGVGILFRNSLPEVTNDNCSTERVMSVSWVHAPDFVAVHIEAPSKRFLTLKTPGSTDGVLDFHGVTPQKIFRYNKDFKSEMLDKRAVTWKQRKVFHKLPHSCWPLNNIGTGT